jgi:hypothetical protein
MDCRCLDIAQLEAANLAITVKLARLALLFTSKNYEK